MRQESVAAVATEWPPWPDDGGLPRRFFRKTQGCGGVGSPNSRTRVPAYLPRPAHRAEPSFRRHAVPQGHRVTASLPGPFGLCAHVCFFDGDRKRYAHPEHFY
jgi:hypothetical protein